MRRRALVVGWALAVGGIACSELFSEANQCSTDLDCARFGASLACSEQGTCVKKKSDPQPHEDAGTGTVPPTGAADSAPPDAPPPIPVASIRLAPETATVPAGKTQAFTATGLDANGKTIEPPPLFVWGVTGPGTIDGGVFRAAIASGGPYTV